MKSFYVVPCLVPPEVLVIDTTRAFTIGLKNRNTYYMFQMSQKIYNFTISSTVSTSRIKVECALVNASK